MTPPICVNCMSDHDKFEDVKGNLMIWKHTEEENGMLYVFYRCMRCKCLVITPFRDKFHSSLIRTEESDMSNWIDQESEQIETREDLKTNMVAFWKAPVGTTNIEVMTEKPATPSNFEGKVNLYIKVDGIEKMWSVTKTSPLYRDVIRALKAGSKKLEIIRVGIGAKDTRYSVKGVA